MMSADGTGTFGPALRCVTTVGGSHAREPMPICMSAESVWSWPGRRTAADRRSCASSQARLGPRPPPGGPRAASGGPFLRTHFVHNVTSRLFQLVLEERSKPVTANGARLQRLTGPWLVACHRPRSDRGRFQSAAQPACHSGLKAAGILMRESASGSPAADSPDLPSGVLSRDRPGACCYWSPTCKDRCPRACRRRRRMPSRGRRR